MNISLDLAYAQASWVKNENNNDWTIKDKDGNKLWSLPGKLNEKEVMSAIRMGREFELKAFNTGIDFGKQEQKRISNLEITNLEQQISILEGMNIKLSNKLEQHIIGGG